MNRHAYRQGGLGSASGTDETESRKQAFDDHPGVGDACIFERAGRFHCAIKNVSQLGTTLLRNLRLLFGLTIGLGYPVTAILTTPSS
jgi:hypothetical protein